MIKIYFDNRLLVLSDKNTIKSKTKHVYESKEKLIDFLNNFNEDGTVLEAAIFHEDLELLFSMVKTNYKFISAAGGFIVNNKNEVLVMFRRGKWDLPKGKVDKGETFENAALREVTEETGIKHLNIVCQLEPTFHIYTHKGNIVLKKTYWYYMNNTVNEELIPQIEEDISELKWISKIEKGTIFSNTYKTILDVFESSDWS